MMDEQVTITVADVGELKLIEHLRARIGGPPDDEVWAGDDTAVLTPQTPALLLTTDLLVEGIDFDMAYCNGGDVGWKALAASASDIAAMCGRPSHAVVALGLPAATPVAFVDQFLDGLLDAAARWEVPLVGGDISAAEEISVTVSMVGRPVSRFAVLRSGARPGDSICVTGVLGGAAAGLIALRTGAVNNEEPGLRRLAERQLRPQARVAEAAILAEFEVSAMIDVSDGLAVDVEHLLDSSGVGCSIDVEAVPVDPDISYLEGANPFDLAVTGGEDFELLFTMRQDQVSGAADALGTTGTPITAIGTVTTSERRIGNRSVEEWRERGWEHLRSP
jgi:thiamine-monophosphate kinase